MARISIRSIVEELLRTQPALATAPDDDFLKAIRAKAKTKGLLPDNLPQSWNLLRQRFAVRAKLAGKKQRPLPKAVTNLINKARQSALEGVAAYNNPMSPFRSGSFIVHMHIAWNALLPDVTQ